MRCVHDLGCSKSALALLRKVCGSPPANLFVRSGLVPFLEVHPQDVLNKPNPMPTPFSPADTEL